MKTQNIMNKRFAISIAFLFIFTSPIFSQIKNKSVSRKVKNEKVKNIDNKKEPIKTTKHITPGVYIEEVPGSIPSVTQVETAIPAFIGYTERGPNKLTKISSLGDYKNIFGGPSNDEIGEFEINTDGKVTSPTISTTPKYRMYYMLEMFFANGGGDCFIISAGHYNRNSVKNNEMLGGLKKLNKEDLPTLILFPDATSSANSEDPAELYKKALAQCAERKDRFLICDVEEVENDISKSADKFRNSIGNNNLKFGAAYFPSLETTLKYIYSEDKIQVKLKEKSMRVNQKNMTLVLRHTDESISTDSNKIEQSLYHAKNGKYRSQYQEIKKIINAKNLELPPSASMAGVYAEVDDSRGVWKAPANVSLNKVKAPKLEINDNEQENLNVSSTGKSINAILSFEGKGVMPWGARTLDGNDNEWKYISVRRFGNMVEKSVRNATEGFVNEPNEANTWIQVKTMTENYLTTLWRKGALAGAKPEESFYVRVGVGQTMTQQDVQDGNMIVEIGIAVVRPAEFIVLKFTQKMANN